MSVKGFAHISNIHYDDSSNADLEINYVGFHTSPIEDSLNVNVPAGATQLQMNNAVSNAVKEALENDGMDIGILDTVKVFGLGLIEL